MIDTKGCKVLKAVGALDLESYTSSGWLLLGVFSESYIETVFETDPVHVLPPNTNANNYGYSPTGHNATVDVRRGYPVQRSLFLIGRDDESALAILKARGDEFEAKYKEWDVKLQDERKALAEVSERLLKSEVAKKQSTEDFLKACDQRRASKDLADKLERDIAKIRTAIGEREMQRIVGGGNGE